MFEDETARKQLEEIFLKDHLPLGHFGLGNIVDFRVGNKRRFLLVGVNPSHLDTYHIKPEVS